MTAPDRTFVGARVAALRDWMDMHSVGACVIHNPANQYYMTGFKAFVYTRLILTVVTRDQVIILTPQLEEENARRHGAADLVLNYREDGGVVPGQSRDPFIVIRETIASSAGKSIGIEKGFTSLGILESVFGAGAFTGSAVGTKTLVDVGDYLAGARAVKDISEITHLRRAADLVSLAVQGTKNAATAGKTEFEIEFLGTLSAVRTMKEVAPEGFNFITITASGIERTVLPHALTCNRTLEERDLIIHRRHIGVKGYEAESERTIFVGQPSPEQLKVFDVMLRAQAAAIDAVTPGVPVARVDEAARAVFEQAGLLQYVQHRTGHGLGLEPHERPFLRCDDTVTILKPGMVFSVEPGVYVPGIGGFRHSDSVLVTETGSDVLTYGGKSVLDCTVI